MIQSSSRLLIVSNRLPVTLAVDDAGAFTLERSSGGLATGLRPAHEASGGLWIGWPGRSAPPGSPEIGAAIDALERERLIAVELSVDEVRRYYEQFSNRVVWPLFHYLLDRVPLASHQFEAYQAVNQKFADATIAVARPGDLIWVHDYQLMLVPALVRARMPEARIGFFLHIPFPALEVFRLLPWRRRLLTGLLGADLIGVHTEPYARHCRNALEHLLHLEFDGTGADYLGRRVRVEAFPLGIDVEYFESVARDPRVLERAEAIRAEAGDRRLLVGVDRLDYTKGIPQRLFAFDRLLGRHPDWRDRVRMIQVAVPSRAGVKDYRTFSREVDALAGRINGRASTVASVPLHYLHRSISEQELVALYRAADAMVVTPLRDGMNLVAKEFIASRVDEGGTLILSEFAGAAEELREALIVNPYDIDVVADAMESALGMSDEERTRRMRALRRRVAGSDVHDWVRRFLAALEAQAPAALHTQPVEALASRIRSFGDDAALVLLCDYDGTLVPLAEVPELAAPDPELGQVLTRLVCEQRIDVHVVSGRPRETLERWLGHLPVTLWAEHGLWRRQSCSDWRALATPERGWKTPVRELMEDYALANAGAHIEDKGDSMAWHYRQCDVLSGREAARRLADEIDALPGAAAIEVVTGSKVVEVRPRGVNKGLAVRAILAEQPAARLVALGDDRTDEDMFALVPPTGLAIHVGAGDTRADHRLPSQAAARRLLSALADEGRS